MDKLKEYKIVQILIGFVCSTVFLFAGYLLGKKTPFIWDSSNQVASLIILTVYVLMFVFFLCFIAIVSKKYDLRYLFYPAATTSLVSIASAYICLQYQELFMLPMYYLGTPIREVARVIEYATTIIDESMIGDIYSGYQVTYVYEADAVLILFMLAIISIVVYELYTANPEQDIKRASWKLQNPARRVALGLTIAYGLYGLLATVSMPFVHEYAAMLPGMIIGILGVIGMVASITFAIYIIPVAFGIYLIVLCIKQARQKNSLKQIFNPLVFSALLTTVVGTHAIFMCTIIVYIGFQD